MKSRLLFSVNGLTIEVCSLAEWLLAE